MSSVSWPSRDFDEEQRRKNALLRRIADTLGCSVEAIVEMPTDKVSLDQAAELLALWLQIKSAAKREAILEDVRRAIREA